MRPLHVLCLALACLAPAGAGAAETYPARPISVIVPVPPGAANDLAARLAGEIITAQTGQPVVISNRGGAGGLIGMSAVAKAAPDGYTLLVASSGQITNTRLLFVNPPLDPVADLEPIAPVMDLKMVAAVNKEVPARTLAQFIALVKARPGEFNFTSAGPGSGTHLAGDQLLRQAGISLPHIAYRGAAPALTDVVAGRVQMITLGANSLMPYIGSGAVRALVVGSNKRLPYLPDVPTAAEAGVPGWILSVWFGMFGPRRMPKEIVDRLNGYVQKLVSDPASMKRISDSFMEAMPMPAEQFGRFVREDAAKWERIIKDAGIQPQ
jgi:tripartite-type tricarboxylate transporter receptor subunit TctC